MDKMKRETVKGYTSQDLNAKCVRIRNRQKLEAKIKRSARRKMKKELEITGVKFFKNLVILKFKDLDNINDVEQFRQAKLLVKREDAVELGEDEYFIADLIGIRVISDEGEELGTISDVLETGANDVYVVSRDGKKDLLIPAIHDCILHVDIEQGQMRVHLLPGLAED